MEPDVRQYGRDGRIFRQLRVAELLSRAELIQAFMALPESWAGRRPTSNLIERLADEVSEFDDNESLYWVDSPYGWRRGSIDWDEDLETYSFTTSDDINPRLQGNAEYSDVIAWAIDGDSWRTVRLGDELPPEVVPITQDQMVGGGAVATIGRIDFGHGPDDESKDKAPSKPQSKAPSVSLPHSDNPVQIPNKEVAMDPLPNSDVKSGLARIEEAIKSSPSEADALKLYVKKSDKSIIRQGAG